MTLALTPLIFNLGPTELIVILVIVLLLFGGSRLAGLGKSTGRALKEFKEETKGLTQKDTPAEPGAPVDPPQQIINPQPGNPQYPTQNYPTQNYEQPPAPPYQANPQPPQQYPSTTPNNLADPSATDARRDA